MELHFSQYFGLNAETLEGYGSVDVSAASDLPLIIDPFLLFTSDKPEYQILHESILSLPAISTRQGRRRRPFAYADQVPLQYEEVKQIGLASS